LIAPEALVVEEAVLDPDVVDEPVAEAEPEVGAPLAGRVESAGSAE
jgi:hypothetical protein